MDYWLAVVEGLRFMYSITKRWWPVCSTYIVSWAAKMALYFLLSYV